MWWRCVKPARSARKFLFYVIVGASVFAAAPAQAQVTTAAQAKALKEALDKLKPGGAEPKDKLDADELIKLAGSVSRVLDPAIAAAAWADDLAVLLADPKLERSDEGLKGALLALNDTIAKFLATSRASASAAPAGDVNAQAKALREILTRLRPVEGEPGEKIDSVTLTQLATAVSRVLEPTLAATMWATDLTFLLAERNPKSADGSLKKVLLVLAAHSGALLQLADLGPQYLNIVQAWFGDLHYIRRAASGQLRISAVTGTGLRVCDATNEVRSVCQAKKTCTFSLDATSPTPAKLCGEHPAPHGSGDVVGVGIEFQCLNERGTDWNALQHDWKVAAGPRPKMVMLRAGTSVTIRCAADHKDPQAGQGEEADEPPK